MDKRMTTSKVLLLAACIYSFILLFLVVLSWVIWDKSDAAGLAGVVISPAVTAIGFYSWKAKAENLIKLQKAGLKMTMEDIDNGNY